MGVNIGNFHRNLLNNSIVCAVLAGILLGFAAFSLKTTLYDIDSLTAFLTSPFVWATGVIGLSGFLVYQKALSKSYVTTAIPLVTGITIILPAVLAAWFLNDVVTITKLSGIALILAGIAGVVKK